MYQYFNTAFGSAFSFEPDFVVLYSGGLGSFAAAYTIKQAYPDKKILLYFNDTLIEDPDLYRFLVQSAYSLDLPLLEDSDGRSVFEVFRDGKFMANTRIDTCSRILKRERSRAFINSLPNKPKVVVGIDWTEIHRYERAKPLWMPFELVAPLADSLVDKNELVARLLKLYNIELPRLYKLGFSHNNCGGFCVKAGLGHFKNLLEKDRESYIRFELEELMTYEYIGAKYPFLRKTVKGVTKYITLQEYRLMLEKGLSLDFEESCDIGGCGCAV